ncbi:hypothetical protein HXX76_005187 [Chlamydomonas incerta]|uniref:Protein kinase domain-containing protein n=1 Tax=Chlamydomonas incerta TaxID=51695 RepID=A0A835W442_CHLIN|nr:hypothetical protein HXX76_005187 [Chlamydomonas incerta]|eukprot:KAG2438640.1 hypothetical protein HXX76_005187 [Chlamydomonas incerta]
MWRGAQASIKIFRVGNPGALAQLSGALCAASGRSHPYLLQYFSCSACLVAAPVSRAAAADPASQHAGTDPARGPGAAPAAPAAAPLLDLLLSFNTLGGGAPSTGPFAAAATAAGGAATAGNSRDMESILGSAFECCLPLPDDGGALTGAEAARLVTEALQPSPGDYLVALVSELCLLGDLRCALTSGVFATSRAQRLAAPASSAAAPAAPSRGCSGGVPAAGARRGGGGGSEGVPTAWTPARAVRAAVATAREAALGVVHLHAGGAAHGNLRPSNIQLMEAHTDRRGFVAKVSDAGLGPRHSEPGPELLAYTAPEALVWGLWAPALPDMQAADVYSFGVILFEMLAGRRPTAQDLQILGHACAAAGGPRSGGAGGAAAAPAQHCCRGPQPLTATPLCPEGWEPAVLPSQLLQLCGWCLQPDSANRPRMDVVAAQLSSIETQLRAAAAEAKQYAERVAPSAGGAAGASGRPLCAYGALRAASAGAVMRPAAGGDVYGDGGHMVVRSAVGMAPPPPHAASLEPLSVRAAVSRLSPVVPESGGLSTGALDGGELALPLLAACGRRHGLHSAESLDWSAIASEDWGS